MPAVLFPSQDTNARGIAVNSTRRSRSRRVKRVLEHLESRCLLAVSSAQGLTVVATDGIDLGASTHGVVAEYNFD
jgi:hypothetical protein